MVPVNNDLPAKVQQTLDKMVKDGAMTKIPRKWFAEDQTNPKKF
jgi:ABC-type amino acid transport substrate-binding protein